MLYKISDMYFMLWEAEIEWEEDMNEEDPKAEIFTKAWLLRNAPPKWTSLILLILNIMSGLFLPFEPCCEIMLRKFYLQSANWHLWGI